MPLISKAITYDHVWVSEVLSDSQWAVLRKLDKAALKAIPEISATPITVSSETIEMYDIRDDVMSVPLSIEPTDVEIGTLADEGNVSDDGKPTTSVTMTLLMDTDANKTFDLLIADPTGKRLMQVGHNGKRWTGVMSLGPSREEHDASTGGIRYEITLRSAASGYPTWV